MTASGQLTIWMRLRNAREVIAGLKNTAAATTFLGNATNRLAKQMEKAGRRTFLMNQALFTLRRYSYMATLALTAGAVAVARWGFQYNSQVQVARVAFQQFGMTAREASNEVDFLFRKIAAPSPFLLQDVALAARRLMAFGLSVTDTNDTLVGLTNALSAFGITTGAALSRATLALGHMLLVGRVTGQALFQLNRDNIPMTEALRTELHLTGDQLRNISALGIPAATAIKALNTYLRETPKFQNAALRFSLKTWSGIVSTTKDYIARFMGAIEEPLFHRLQRRAKTFLKWLTSAQVTALSGRGDIIGLAGLISPNAERAMRMLIDTLKATWRLLTDAFIPAVMYVSKVAFPTLYIALQPTIKALQFLSRHTFIAKVFFALLAAEVAVLAIRYAVLLPIQMTLLASTIAYNAVRRIGIALGLIELIVIKDNTGAIIFQTVVITKLGRVMRAILLLRRAEIGLMIGQILYTTRLGAALQLLWRGYAVGNFAKASYGFRTLEGRILRLRIFMRGLVGAVRAYTIAMYAAARSMIVFLFTNPVGWAILLIGALVVLYFKWDRFHRLVDKFGHWLMDHKFVIAAALTYMFGPIGIAAGAVILLWDKLKALYAWIDAHRPKDRTPGPSWWKIAHLPSLPTGMASGGVVRSGGLAMVGEEGPEILSLPRNARVDPIGKAGSSAGIGGIIQVNLRSVLEVDGRQMAEVVSKHRLDAHARY